METMQAETLAELPTGPAKCRTLAEWRTLVLGKSQSEVAQTARVKQSRISAVECGRVLPRRKHWSTLIAGYQRDAEPKLTDADFYRMVVYARQTWLKAKALQGPASDDVPLFSTNAHAPAGSIVMTKPEAKRRQA